MTKLSGSRPCGAMRARLERIKGATLYSEAIPTAGFDAEAEDSVAVRLQRLRVALPSARGVSAQTTCAPFARATQAGADRASADAPAGIWSSDESTASTRTGFDAKAQTERTLRFTSRACNPQAGANVDAALASLAGGQCIAPGLIEVTRRLSHGTRHGVEVLESPARAKTMTGAVTPVYFDTETTGLAGGTGTAIFMLGFAFHDEAARELVIKQLMLSGFHGEAALFERASALLPSGCVLTSYNGRSFDAPLVDARARLSGRPDPLASHRHIDLLYPVRRAFSRVWPDCKLSTVESRLLQFERADDLPGAMAPQAWVDWLVSARPAALMQVLEHNLWDLVSLAALDGTMGRCLSDPVAWGANPLAFGFRSKDGPQSAAQGESCDELYAYLLTNQRRLLPDAAMALSRMARRRGEWSVARAIWERLAATGRTDAALALAKLYEHKLSDAHAALAMTRTLRATEPGEPAHHLREVRLLSRISKRSATTRHQPLEARP